MKVTKTLLIFLLFFGYYHSTFAQAVFVNKGFINVFTPADANEVYLTIKGDLTHAGSEISNTGIIEISGNLIDITNNGVFPIVSGETAGEVCFTGKNSQISSDKPIIFHDVQVDLDNNNVVSIRGDQCVYGKLRMQNGDLNLQKSNLLLSGNGTITNETNDHRIYSDDGGKIKLNDRYEQFVDSDQGKVLNIGNMGIYFKIPSFNSLDVLEVSRGHKSLSGMSQYGSIKRFFDVYIPGINYSDDKLLPSIYTTYLDDNEFKDGMNDAYFTIYRGDTITDDQVEWEEVSAGSVFPDRDSLVVENIVDINKRWAISNCNSVPDVNLGNDLLLCLNDVASLDATTSGYTYFWDTEEDNPFYDAIHGAIVPKVSIEAQSEFGAAYWVRVRDELGCVNYDTVKVNVNGLPIVDLGPDFTFFAGTPKQLDAGKDFVSYKWSDDSENRFMDVTDEGFYSVTVTDTLGCSSSDEVFASMFSEDDSAFFLAPTFVLTDDSVQFVELSSSPPDRVEWDFDVANLPVVRDNDPLFIFTESGVYLVRLSVFWGSYSDDYSKAIMVDNSGRLDDFGDKAEILPFDLYNVSLYPNPTVEEFIFEAELPYEENILLELYDATGKPVKSVYRNAVNKVNEEFSLRNLPNGLYILKVSAKNKSTSLRILKGFRN